jgi:hypothetical protein
MRLKLEDIEIPLGTVKPFMSCWDSKWCGDNDCGSEFELEIAYPPIGYSGEIYWNEFSYRRYTDTSLTWTYDVYSCGEW